MPTCGRRLRLYALKTTPVSRVFTVEGLPAGNDVLVDGETGAIRLQLGSGYLGLFRSCTFEDYSYVNEVVAHEIDRLLHLYRVPAVALKQIAWSELLVATQQYPIDDEALERLYRVRDRCNGSGKLLTGALVGWTNNDLRVVQKGVLSDWLAHAAFDPMTPTQRLMEFVKLAIATVYHICIVLSFFLLIWVIVILCVILCLIS